MHGETVKFTNWVGNDLEWSFRNQMEQHFGIWLEVQ